MRTCTRIRLAPVAQQEKPRDRAPEEGVNPPQERETSSAKQRKDAAAVECVNHSMKCAHERQRKACTKEKKSSDNACRQD